MASGDYRNAIYDALTDEYGSMLPEVIEEHVFSPGFENRMNKLVKRRNRSYYMMINTAGKRIACIAGIVFIVSFSTVMSVSALREAFKDLFINIYKRFSVVRAAEDVTSPEKIEDIYGITVDQSGYEVIYNDLDDHTNNIIYSDKDNNIIDFSQYVKSEFDMGINTESAEITHININGKEAVYYEDNRGYNTIIWDNGDYIIMISASIGEDALKDIANSVQKVE